jgi:hypothetical protein
MLAHKGQMPLKPTEGFSCLCLMITSCSLGDIHIPYERTQRQLHYSLANTHFLAVNPMSPTPMKMAQVFFQLSFGGEQWGSASGRLQAWAIVSAALCERGVAPKRFAIFTVAAVKSQVHPKSTNRHFAIGKLE